MDFYFLNIHQLLHLGKVLVEHRDSAYTLVKLLKTVALVRRVNSILGQAETDKDRLNTQDTLKAADDRDRATRVEG
jgi:hypothetical protein